LNYQNFTESLDAHRTSRRKMEQPTHQLRSAISRNATSNNFAFDSRNLATANRAMRGRLE
jgi:hypothetical protein